MISHGFGQTRTTIREIDRYVSIDRTSARQLVKKKAQGDDNDKANDDDYDMIARRRKRKRKGKKVITVTKHARARRDTSCV